jgi:hypothetical protein
MLDGQGILLIGNLQLLQLAFQISHLLQALLQHLLCYFLFNCGQLKSLRNVAHGMGKILGTKQMVLQRFQ